MWRQCQCWLFFFLFLWTGGGEAWKSLSGDESNIWTLSPCCRMHIITSQNIMEIDRAVFNGDFVCCSVDLCFLAKQQAPMLDWKNEHCSPRDDQVRTWQNVVRTDFFFTHFTHLSFGHLRVPPCPAVVQKDLLSHFFLKKQIISRQKIHNFKQKLEHSLI